MITADEAKKLTEKVRTRILGPIENLIVAATNKGHNYIQLEVDNMDSELMVALDNLSQYGYTTERIESPSTMSYTYKIIW